jgi:hypothetical protein
MIILFLLFSSFHKHAVFLRGGFFASLVPSAMRENADRSVILFVISLRAVYTRVFCVRFSVHDGATAQLLSLLFSRKHVRDRPKENVGRRRYRGRRNGCKNHECRRPFNCFSHAIAYVIALIFMFGRHRNVCFSLQQVYGHLIMSVVRNTRCLV